MTFTPDLQSALASIERDLHGMSEALISGDPQALASASGALRQGAIDFSQLLQRLSPAQRQSKLLQARLKKIASDLAIRRESLIRRTVLVERALNAVVPATRSTTYAKTAGPYGAPGKSSGSFKYLAS